MSAEGSLPAHGQLSSSMFSKVTLSSKICTHELWGGTNTQFPAASRGFSLVSLATLTLPALLHQNFKVTAPIST